MYVIIYDFGTSSVKTCLFDIDSEIRLVTSSTASYGLYISADGGAEQDTEEWWAALCKTTKTLFKNTTVKNTEIEGLAFCSQMQGTVLVDKDANAVRPPMNYLDQKGVKEYKDCMGTGLIKVSGCSLYKLVRNLIVNYAGSTSAKDPVWKYKWVENHEPDVYKKIYKWLDIGLVEGIPVFGGGGDTTFVNIGAGCTRPGDTHIYIGTSGWVSTYLDYQTVDINAMITGVLSAKRGYFNYYAELETAGKCFEWVMKHLALDEVGVYLNQAKITDDVESKYKSIYEFLSEEVDKVPPGANGVIFTPWLHGNRCPFEDSNAAGMFFNIRVRNGKRDMIRAVLEGICYHLRWLLECEARKVKTSNTIRFVGGGALSPVTCQMLSDITGRTIETVKNTQEVGAIGTALVVAAGIKGVDVLELSRELVKVEHIYKPNSHNKEVYERNYKVFKRLYKSNAENFKDMNQGANHD